MVAVTVALAVTLTKKDEKKPEPEKDGLVTIETGCQNIQGKMHLVKTDEGVEKKVYEFRNVPYALPPTEKRRWRPPSPLKGTDCPSETLKYSNAVVQCKQKFGGKIVGGEDCLILNIRTPVPLDELNGKKKLPVFFWIHGGGLWFGSSHWPGVFPDEQFSASMDVVSVAINYRLNVFGFLSLEELWINSGADESYGNYGILDQIQALKWVQENIEKFGGDPDRVTIYGVSGGGKSVYDLIASPRATGLFHKAIAGSGYPIAPNTTKEYANGKFRVFVNDTGCNKTTSEETFNCLYSISEDVIIGNEPWTKYPEPNDYWFEFPMNKTKDVFPVDIIDYYVIPETISRITKTSNPGMEILFGTTSQEANFSPNATSWALLDEYLKPRVDTFKTGIYDDLLKMYKERRADKVSPENITSQYVYTTMASDALLSCQTNEFVEYIWILLKISAVYRFVVSQGEPTAATPNFSSAFHGIDVVALFGNTVPRLIADPVNDRYLMLNIRRVFKEFIHSKPRI